nr:endogenous retrovirus group K member 19 Env polyprotein-like isoform X2 [Loxodonta africana]
MQDPKTTKIPPTLPPSLLTNLTPPTTLLRNLSLENAPSTPPPSPVSSSPSSSSSTPPLLTDFIQPSTNLNNSSSRDKVRWRSRRHTPYSRTHQTIAAEPPTWGQLKKLTHLAHILTVDQHIPVNAGTLFVAMLAIISCQVCVVMADMHWAYVPKPPIFHPVTWEDPSPSVFTNNSALLGGETIFWNPQGFNSNYSYSGMSDNPPICIQLRNLRKTIPGCIPFGFKSMITDSPNGNQNQQPYRLLWALRLILPEKTDFLKGIPKVHTPLFPTCDKSPPEDSKSNQDWAMIDPSKGFPIWRNCMYNSQVVYALPKMSARLIDCSILNPEDDYRLFLQSARYRFNWQDTLVPLPQKVNRWHINGWVPPILSTFTGNIHPSLWRLATAAGNVTLSRPFNNESFDIQACVPAPYVLLISRNNHSSIVIENKKKHYVSSCKNCILTSCINPAIPVESMMILQQPKYIMIPVHLQEDWYDDSGLEALKQASAILSRAKRFVAALILGISALIALATSLSLSAMALTQQIHTANYVNNLSKNITLALATQEAIDRKLQQEVNALEEAILYIGQEITNLKVRLTLRCHSSSES